MSGDLPPDLGGGSTLQPPVSPHWSPTNTERPVSGSRIWPAIALGAISIAVIAVLVAVAALIVCLTRQAAPGTAPANAAATYTAAEIATAEHRLCDTYKLHARAVRADTSRNDEALARIAATNGAVMLYNAAADPALEAKYRDAARALATAYGDVSAMGSKGVATDAEWQAVLDDANAKDAAMKKVCDGG